MITATVDVPGLFEQTAPTGYQTPEGYHVYKYYGGSMRSVTILHLRSSLPDRGPLPEWISPINPEYVCVFAKGFGWPRTVLVNEETGVPPTKAELERELTVDDFCSAGFDSRSVVLSHVDITPFHGLELRFGGRVYLPGLCFNTAIYALAVFTLATATSTTRNALRRRLRPGDCPSCNYNLCGLALAPGASTTVCPECGTRVPAATSTARVAQPN
ncbi:MAG: hypothetical protein K2X32_07355 [Phycisphaerales bacterium]|nr:hypothetical protein [Phycisphaerales bacterium]